MKAEALVPCPVHFKYFKREFCFNLLFTFSLVDIDSSKVEQALGVFGARR